MSWFLSLQLPQEQGTCNACQEQEQQQSQKHVASESNRTWQQS